MNRALAFLAPALLAGCAPPPEPTPAPQDGIVRAALKQRVYVDGPWVTPLAVLKTAAAR